MSITGLRTNTDTSPVSANGVISVIILLTFQWDQRKWKIWGHLTCSTPNVVYLIRCKLHKNACYVGSTKNLKLRWAKHKSDAKLKRVNKCSVAHHVNAIDHPNDTTFSYLQIFAIEVVSDEIYLVRRETWWQCNLGTIFKGLNVTKDIQPMMKSNIRTLY